MQPPYFVNGAVNPVFMIKFECDFSLQAHSPLSVCSHIAILKFYLLM